MIMSAAVETMAYAGETPWHGLGKKVSDALTPDEMLKEAGLDWEVRRVPLVLEGTNAKIDSHFALERSSDKSILGICGKDWQPTQNKQAFSFFREFTEAGHMKMETAGSLLEGRQTWALAAIKKSFALKGKDEVGGYLLLSNPHIWGKRILAAFTTVRVVCNNTLTMAVNGAKGNSTFKMTHTNVFDEAMQEKATVAMGMASKKFDEFQEAAELLATTRINDDQLCDFLKETFHPTIQYVTLNDEKVVDLLGRTAQRVREAIETQPGADLESSKGTYWGALNAVTYLTDHKLGRTQDNRLASAWFGTNANLKARAFETAIEHAKAA
tara:strand:- start:14233 stop:15210 length:978 start_codon:yes stop_codon:yes gene_type:complete